MEAERKKLFATLEGIDGTGKSAVMPFLARHFGEGRVFLTANPSYGPIGLRIRDMLEGKLKPPSPKAFQVLYAEDRKDHLKREIKPQLEQGKIVVSDRFRLSTVAYGMLDGTAEEYLALQQEIIGEDMIIPDVTFLFDLPVEEAIRRIQKSGRGFDWFAKKEKLGKIRQNYLELADRDDLPEDIMIIDASRPFEEVVAGVIDIMEYYLS